MKHITIALLFILIPFGIYSQEASLDCLVVDDINGTVHLQFSGHESVTRYKIYRSTQINGSYFLVGSTSGGASNNYTDFDINASSQSYSYFVEAIIDGHESGASNKMRTILLNTTDLHNGIVRLNWNNPEYSSSNNYQVWRKESSTAYQLLTTISDESYHDTIEECRVNYYYQIRVNTGQCESVSSLRGGTFEDITAPDEIVPKNASVDLETGDIILSWFLPSIENDDIDKYQVWLMNSEGQSDDSYPEAEIIGYHNTSIHLSSDLVCDSTITYVIIAIDVCGNSVGWNSDGTYFIRTLNMRDPIYNICNDECIITWDSVYAWQDADVDGIRVYRQKGDQDFEIIADVAGDQTSAFTYGYERGVKYRFYIESYSKNSVRTSTSCIKKITGKKPTTPAYNWLRYASVSNGEVQLKWQVDSSAYIPFYAVSRSEDGVNYQIIDTVKGSSDTIHSYIDISSKYYKSPQYYQVSPFDSCLNLGDASNYAKTIHVTVGSHSDGKALIEWTAYETMSDLQYYNVYRIIDSLIYPFPIVEVFPDETLSYIDDYGLSVPLMAKVGYLVEAVGKVVDSLYQQDTAKSNINFLAKVSNLFVPSGFNPQGNITTVFKPIYTGVKLVNYNFKVLNRWGQIVFETHQPVLGWDGKFLGEYVAPGAFVYVIEYETIYGKKKRESGMFMVM